jgi:hypothetical protein
MGSLLTMFSNWKTASAGVLALVGLAGQLVMTITSPDTTSAVNSIWTEVSALGAGLVGLFAKDHNVTNAPVPVAPKITNK